MSIIFFGSPDFAVPTLKALINADETIAAVVTQPDKPCGRSGKSQPCAVKACALEHGIKALSPPNMKDEAFIAELQGYKPEFFVVVAYRLHSDRLAVGGDRAATAGVACRLGRPATRAALGDGLGPSIRGARSGSGVARLYAVALRALPPGRGAVRAGRALLLPRLRHRAIRWKPAAEWARAPSLAVCRLAVLACWGWRRSTTSAYLAAS